MAHLRYAATFRKPRTGLRVLKRRIQKAWKRGLTAYKRVRGRHDRYMDLAVPSALDTHNPARDMPK